MISGNDGDVCDLVVMIMLVLKVTKRLTLFS